MANQRYLSDKNETLVIRFLVIVVSYFLLRNLIRNLAQKAEQQAVLSGDTNALLAVQVRQSINPSGFSWLIGFDGTDREALFNAARKMTDPAKVATAYRNLYGSDMGTDVQNDVSSADFALFQSLLGKGGATGKYFVKAASTTAFEVINYDASKDQVGSIGGALETYKTGQPIEADFVELLGRGTPTGTDYLLFKDTSFFFFDRYFVIPASDLILL